MSRVAWLSMTGTALLSLCACHYKGPPVVMRVVEDFFEAFDAPLVVDDVLDAGVVTLTTLGGASSGARATRDGEDVFELIRGSAFVTTDASPNGTTTAGGGGWTTTTAGGAATRRQPPRTRTHVPPRSSQRSVV